MDNNKKNVISDFEFKDTAPISIPLYPLLNKSTDQVSLDNKLCELKFHS